MSDESLESQEPSPLIVDDHMTLSDINWFVTDIFTIIFHHSNISVQQLMQSLLEKNKYARKISMNAYYLILCKNLRFQ